MQSPENAPSQCSELATRLFDAKQTGVAMARCDAGVLPVAIVEAYAVQEKLIELDGRRPRAWKLGAPSFEIQRRMGFAEPFSGPVFDAVYFQTGAVIDPNMFSVRLFEPEVAFKMGQDLVGSPDLSAKDARAAIASFHPALEILSFRIENAIDIGPNVIIADCGLNGGLVLGPAMPVDCPSYFDLDLEVRVGGHAVASRAKVQPETDPVLLLVWLAQHLEQRGHRLRKGDVVTTGSQCGLPSNGTRVGIVPFEIGDRIEADFGVGGIVSADMIAAT